MSASKIFINQDDNHNANFGEVLRSSAIFWVKNDDEITTTISFSNYWKFKNNNDVYVLANLRKLDGTLIKRIKIDFQDRWVCNYCPPNNFEGSFEIEAFSNKNLRIPYAAVMSIYESKNSISMVHSYSRIYSQHEIEDNRTISLGEESCWTIRDSINISSFAIVHNGANSQLNQEIKLCVRNIKGNEKTVHFNLDTIKPYETIIFEPKKYFPDLINWLDGFPGNARISFSLNGSFTRMLCGNKNIKDNQLQLTHSNFDYSVHKTNKISGKNLNAYMKLPCLNGDFYKEVVIYPDSDFGEYIAQFNDNNIEFKTGEIHQLKFKNKKENTINFTRKGEFIPSRLVTGLRLQSTENTMPAECSLGIIHHQRPKKNFHWMVVSLKFNTCINWVDYSEVYGGSKKDDKFVFKLYNSKNCNVLEKIFYGTNFLMITILCYRTFLTLVNSN